MAETFIQNMRDPSERIGIMVTIKRMVVRQDQTGRQMWMIQASTLATDADGVQIQPVYKWTSNQTTFSDDIQDLIDQINVQVAWNNEPDTTPPEILNTWPLDGATGIPVDTEIRVNIADLAPSSGLDISSIKVKVKGFDLTEHLTINSNINTCSIYLTPGTKYQSAVNEDFANGSER
jgi:hypothetical protein